MRGLVALAFLVGGFAFAGKAPLIYRRSFPGAVPSFDPGAPFDRFRLHLQRQVFDSVASAARAVTFDAKKNTHTIVLRDDVFFHDGKKVSADDVVFSLESARASVGNALGAVAKKDPTIVQVQLIRPYPAFDSWLASPQVVLLPNQLRNRKPEGFFAKPIATGPYRVETVGKDLLVLVRHGNTAAIERLEYFFESPEKAYERVRANSVDDIYPLPPPSKVPDSFEFVSYPCASTVLLAFQESRTPFDEYGVRAAVRAAIDNTAWKPLTMARGILPPQAVGFDSVSPSNHFAPKSIEALLAATRYGKISEVPAFAVNAVLDPSTGTDVPHRLVEMLRVAGFRPRLIEQSQLEWRKDRKAGVVDSTLISLPLLTPEPYSFLERWRLAFEPKDLELGSLFAKAFAEAEGAERAKLWEGVSRRLVEHAHTHNLYYVTSETSLRRKGWRFPEVDLAGALAVPMARVRFE